MNIPVIFAVLVLVPSLPLPLSGVHPILRHRSEREPRHAGDEDQIKCQARHIRLPTPTRGEEEGGQGKGKIAIHLSLGS